MKFKWQSVVDWWSAHKADEEASLTFIHKYPMQLIILVLMLCLLVTCGHKPTCPNLVSYSASPAQGPVRFSQLPINIPIVEPAVFMVYEYPRADGGSAYLVPASNVGDTLLRDGDNGHTLGSVYIDAAAQSVIVRVNKVYVGIK